MPVDIPTFRIYAKISDYIYNNFSDETVSQEKLREIIGTEFNIMSASAIERHFQNMVMAKFIHATVSGMKATKINWTEFEDKIRRKTREIAEEEVKKNG